MNLQEPLTSEPTPSSQPTPSDQPVGSLDTTIASEMPITTNPDFNHSTFDEKLNTGWLKNYYFGIIGSFTVTFFYIVFDLRYGFLYLFNPIPTGTVVISNGKYTLDYYNTFFYGLSLIALGVAAILLALSLLLQYEAIKHKSLEKQEAAITITFLFILGHACASGASIVFAFISTPISMISTLVMCLIILAAGFALRFFASNVRNIMLGRLEEPFKVDVAEIQKEVQEVLKGESVKAVIPVVKATFQELSFKPKAADGNSQKVESA